MPVHRTARLVLFALAIAGVGGCARDTAGPQRRMLRDDELPATSLGHGLKVSLSGDTNGYVLIAVSQDNVDVQLGLTGADGHTSTYDAPARRAAPERACWYGRPGDLRLEISTHDRVARSPNKFRLQVAFIESPRGLALGGELQAECLESRAALAQGGAQDYQRAAEIWSARGARSRAAYAHLQAAWALTMRAENLAAFKEGCKARTEFELLRNRVGVALANLQIAVPRSELIGDGKDENGQHASDMRPMLAAAQSEIETARASFESAGMSYFAAYTTMLQGANRQQNGDVTGALRLFDEAAQVFEAAGELDGVTQALSNSAVILRQAGQYRKAAAVFDRVLAGNEDVAAAPVLGDILDNSAATHSDAGNYDRALLQSVRALRIHEDNDDVPGQIRSLNGLALTYMRLGNPRAALEHLARSRRLIEERRKTPGHERETVQVTSVLLAGDAHRALGEMAAAKASHDEALTLAGTPALQVQARLALARDALSSGDALAALAGIAPAAKIVSAEWGTLKLQLRLEHARAQVELNRVADASKEFSALRGKFEAAGSPEFELEVLQGLAQTQFRQNRIDEALATNERAVAQLKSLRLASGNPELRARLNAVHRSAHELRVDLLAAKRGAERNPKRRMQLLAQIFAAADEARSGLVRASSLAAALSTPDRSSSERQLIAGEIALRQNNLSMLELAAGDSTQSKQLRAELASLRARFDALSAEDAARLPEFADTDYAVEGLRDDFAVLVFLRSSSVIHRYLLTREGIEDLPVLQIARVSEQVRQALAELDSPASRSQTDSHPAIDAISRTLLPRAGTFDRRKHLIVVADSITSNLPFGALNGTESGYLPLVSKQDVSMALTLRDALRIARTSDERMRVDLSLVAVFADPVFNALDTRVKNTRGATIASPLPRLAATAQEATGIAALLPKASVRQYSGFAATRAALLSDEVNRATVLHLATHAVASDQWPNGSGLLLTGSKADGTPLNGYVSTLDLFSRRATTDLVVLSACDSARGDSTPAESVAGLARAFLGGGTRRVVAAHWPVEDTVTARLMQAFYARLASGETAADALNGAQRQLLATPEMHQPSRWAAFVIYESSPPG